MVAAIEPDHRRYRRLIDAHFRGRSAPAGERAMRVHLVGCDDCRDHYQRHLDLCAVDPVAALPARERLARGLGLGVERMRVRLGWLVLAPALAAALVLVGTGRGPSSPQPRGPVSSRSPGSQLLVYEVARHAPVRQALGRIERDSGLAFAYANVDHRQRLWVFAVDERRRVYWYHPAWNDEAENPAGIRLVMDDAVHEIPQAVFHHFEGRQVQLFGVFADRAMSVRDVETAVAGAPSDRQGSLVLALPEAEVIRLELQVEGPP